MVPYGSKWLRMPPNASKWLQMAPNGVREGRLLAVCGIFFLLCCTICSLLEIFCIQEQANNSVCWSVLVEERRISTNRCHVFTLANHHCLSVLRRRDGRVYRFSATTVTFANANWSYSVILTLSCTVISENAFSTPSDWRDLHKPSMKSSQRQSGVRSSGGKIGGFPPHLNPPIK